MTMMSRRQCVSGFHFFIHFRLHIYYLVRKHIHDTEMVKNIMAKLYSLTGILEVTQADCIDAFIKLIENDEKDSE